MISVSVGPSPRRPKYPYDKSNRRTHEPLNATKPYPTPVFAINLVKDVLSQLAKEIITRQVNEDFVFGQYIGNAMKNLTHDLRLRMQHEVLDLVVKYQRLNRGEKVGKENKSTKERKVDVTKTNRRVNDTEDNWPDFSNLNI